MGARQYFLEARRRAFLSLRSRNVYTFADLRYRENEEHSETIRTLNTANSRIDYPSERVR